MIRRFIFSAIIGFISHQASRITKRMPVGWRNLTDHTVGMITVTPLIIIWWRFLHSDFRSDEQIEREIVASIGLASLGYGVGNATAWLLDTILGVRYE